MKVRTEYTPGDNVVVLISETQADAECLMHMAVNSVIVLQRKSFKQNGKRWLDDTDILPGGHVELLLAAHEPR